MKTKSLPSLPHPDRFVDRHLGPRQTDVDKMLETVGADDLEALLESIIPAHLIDRPQALPEAHDEQSVLGHLKSLARRNEVYRSYIGCGYVPGRLPPVILRNVLENPGWYTQYTPYQSEIAQGRLEALLNFQTMVCDLTGLPVANSSLLDEATAAAEAMTLMLRMQRRLKGTPRFLVDPGCHPQVIEVVQGRAEPLGIEVVVQEPGDLEGFYGCLLSYPDTDGRVRDLEPIVSRAHEKGATVAVACDMLALVALKSPGSMGADVCVGSSQRFGMPLGHGGPHAAFMSCHEKFKRQMPGRIVGLSTDRLEQPALRLALQTREQHIRRDRATSNICTAQVLPAVVASMYGVYHGPEGLTEIAEFVHQATRILAATLEAKGIKLRHQQFFDTLRFEVADLGGLKQRCRQQRVNLRYYDDGSVGLTLDEQLTDIELLNLAELLTGERSLAEVTQGRAYGLKREADFMTHANFHRYRSETELLRYMKKLENRDLSLTHAMIPLGSCTMKLNATAEMIPITWPEFADIHPFAPSDQIDGYTMMIDELSRWLADITGFAGVSLQPNAGSQGEYAGLLTIRAYHRSRGDENRRKVLIPISAHGTNPASASLAGLETVVVKCDDHGNIDLTDLKRLAEEHSDELAALMVTYPSTHGVFEDTVRQACEIIHQNGGQVYLDGANMNALVGWCRPGQFGADVCHLNLHKTFCIPHGGGGPGMGPICAAPHLVDFLPGHGLVETGGAKAIPAVSAAPWGSTLILPITYAYIAMMGHTGLKSATEIAILNANYIAKRLEGAYKILYTGNEGRVAHECIVDCRPFKTEAGVEVEDIAKRLIDYGFHAPTMSWPVAGTLMIEPTESESLEELDRFCEAMLMIREEIQEIADGKADRESNLLKGSPHPAHEVCGDQWDHPYSRERAAYPTPATRHAKFWPYVARVDNAKGDRNLVCSCQDFFATLVEES